MVHLVDLTTIHVEYRGCYAASSGALQYLCMGCPVRRRRQSGRFSVAGLASNRLHSALSPEHVDMQVVMHANTDLIE